MRHPQLILPPTYTDPTGLIRVGAPPSPPALGLAERTLLPSLLGPANALAFARLPSFHDQIRVFATHDALFDYVVEAEFRAIVDAEVPTPDEVVASTAQVPFEPAMRFLASLQKALALRPPNDPSWQRWLMFEVYGRGLVSLAGARFLREHQNGVIFSEQQIFALQRLLLIHGHDPSPDEWTPDNHTELVRLLFYVPGTILDLEASHGDTELGGVDDEGWIRYFIGNGGLVAHDHPRADLPRARRMFDIIAKSSSARQHRDYCNLDDWLVSSFGCTFRELQALGLSLHAGAQIMSENGPPVAVRSDYFASTLLTNKIDRALLSIAADRDWFRTEFAKSTETPRRAAFEIQPFLRRPGLRQNDGSILVLAPRAIEGWLSATGAYYRLFDLARERGTNDVNRFRRFNGFILERYIRHLTHVAHPHPERRARVGAVGRVLPATTYKVKRRGTSETSDVAIDYGTDLILIEVTAKRVTIKSLVEADAESVRSDLQMLVLENMKQLGRVIRDLFELRATLTDVDIRIVDRVWPVIVSSESLLQNPTLWRYLHEHGDDLLDLSDVAPGKVRPVTLLDVEEYELLMGLVANGHALTKILEVKTSEVWCERDFKSFLSDGASPTMGEKAFPFRNSELRRAFVDIVRSLDGGRGTRPVRALAA